MYIVIHFDAQGNEFIEELAEADAWAKMLSFSTRRLKCGMYRIR